MNKAFIFAVGGIVGALITSVYFDKKNKDSFEGEKEQVDPSDDGCDKDKNPNIERVISGPGGTYTVYGKDIDENKDRTVFTPIEAYKQFNTNLGYRAPEYKEDIETVKHPYPYLISEDDFYDRTEFEDFEQMSLTWYKKDQILMEPDNRLPIRDMSIIGDEAYNNLLDDKNLVCIYVRNERIKVDYEITVSLDSSQDA